METEKERFTRRALKFGGYLSDPLVKQLSHDNEFSETIQPDCSKEDLWKWCNDRMDVFVTLLEKENPEHPLLNQIR